MLTSRSLLSDQIAARTDGVLRRARRTARRIRAVAWLEDNRSPKLS